MSTKSQNWYTKNVREDEEDIEVIGDLARKALYDKLSINILTNDVVMAIYGSIFNVIQSYVKEQQAECSSFQLTIANRFEIGYTNTDNDDQEKVGNFMVYMKVLENKTMDNEIDEDEERTIELAAQWNAANITSNVETIKEISSRAVKAVSEDVDVELGSLELIIPIFCIIHEQIVAYLKIKRAELNVTEYEINLCNLCFVGAQCDEELNETVYFRPTVSRKRGFKNDKVAAGDSEE